MTTDNILEIGIDKDERLYIKPERERFTLIWRSATEVHWDMEGKFLYSPKPREWSYLDWYNHIIAVVKDGSCMLTITENTVWVNIDEGLKRAIEQASSLTN